MAAAPPNTRAVVGSVCIALSVAVLCFVLFSSLRTPVRRVHTAQALASSATGNATGLPPMTNATLTAACMSACSTRTCVQSRVTGVVTACTTCGAPLQLVQGRCVSFERDCPLAPWCSTTEAAVARRVHGVLAPLASNHTAPYTGDITRTGNWTTVAAAGLTPVVAVRMLDLLIAGRAAIVDAGWFDDQRGWWGTHLDAYQESVPVSAYVTDVKRTLCTRVWLATSTACQPPTIV